MCNNFNLKKIFLNTRLYEKVAEIFHEILMMNQDRKTSSISNILKT